MGAVVNMHAAKSNLSRLVKRAAAGEGIVIASHGRPLALLTKLPAKRVPIPWGIFEGKIKLANDFDAPLKEFEEYM